MQIKRISIEELKQMTNSEGLILQGCGGDLQEWVDGINHVLTDEGILLGDSTFIDVSVFENEGLTNLLFILDKVKINMGKLAMWRLNTHENFGGTWLSDYPTNRLQVDVNQETEINEQQKPDCPIIGADGNIFNIMGIASCTLKKCGQHEQATQMREQVQNSGDYNKALAIIMEYVNPVSVEEYQDMNSEFGMGGIE